MRRVILILGLACLAGPVQADEAELVVRGYRFDPFRGDRAFASDDVVITEREAQTPVDQILRRQAGAGLFRRTSSLAANPTGQGLGFRAIAPSGAGRALVTLDGVPINDPFGGWVVWAGLPSGAVGSAHIVRGSGGGAYGAGALTGVAELRGGAESPMAQVSAGGGDNRHLAIGGFGLHAEVRRLETEVPVRGAGRGLADVPATGDDAAWIGRWEVPLCEISSCPRLEAMIGQYRSRRDTGLEGATATSRGDHAAVTLLRRPSVERTGYRAQLWVRQSDLSNRSVSVTPGRSSTTLANDQYATPSEGWGVTFAVRRLGADYEFEAGFDGRATTGEAQETYRYQSGQPTRRRVAGGRTTLAGLYAEASRTWGPLTLSGAVRADTWRSFDGHRRETDLMSGATVLDIAFAERDEAVVTGRAGAVFRASQHVSVRAAAYSGFRPPSLNELYRPFRIGNDVTEANAELRPETLSGLEIGVRHEGKINIDVTVFDNRLKDPVVNVTLGFGPGTFPQAGFVPAGGAYRQRRNQGDIRALGAEASFDTVVGGGWQVSGQMTVTRARVAGTRLRPAQAPDYSLWARLEGPVGRWRVAAELGLEGERFEDDLNTLSLEAMARLDLSVERPLTSEWTVGVRLMNALDADIPVSMTQDGTTGLDDGRRLFVTLRYRL